MSMLTSWWRRLLAVLSAEPRGPRGLVCRGVSWRRFTDEAAGEA